MTGGASLLHIKFPLLQRNNDRNNQIIIVFVHCLLFNLMSFYELAEYAFDGHFVFLKTPAKRFCVHHSISVGAAFASP